TQTEIYLEATNKECEITGKEPTYHNCGMCKSKTNAIAVYMEQLNLLDAQINSFYTISDLSNIESFMKENPGKNLTDLLNIPHTGIAFIGLENSEQVL
ncbi:unnamed protein product, partial [Schistosoma turkestanicum]